MLKYKDDPQIKAMTDLVDAYQRREVHLAEKILKDDRSVIMDDHFIRFHIGELLRSLAPNTSSISLSHALGCSCLSLQKRVILFHQSFEHTVNLSLQQLNVETEEVEELLIGLILEGRVEGCIDKSE